MTHDEIADAYRQYGHLVLRRCRRIVRRDDAAEDALQEVFVRLWRYGDAFRAAESKVAWLYRVADRCCFDVLARDRTRREVSLDGTAAETLSEGGDARALEDGELVLRFLERFDDRMRELAVLHYLDGMTQEEIATATGWSRQTVVKKLAFLAERADKLRASLLSTPALPPKETR
jgi:RNA polymerase sigma-70 factor (ECF subfamily)